MHQVQCKFYVSILCSPELDLCFFIWKSHCQWNMPHRSMYRVGQKTGPFLGSF